MSSPRAVAKKARRGKPRRSAPAQANPSAQALRLADAMEHGLAEGRFSIVSDQARQRLMAALCKIYSQQVQGGAQSLPLRPRSGVSPTDVMITASGMLRAADLQVFELGMWQSWTGR